LFREPSQLRRDSEQLLSALQPVSVRVGLFITFTH